MTVVRKGEGRKRVVLLTRRKKVMLTQDHEPPDNQPSQPSTSTFPSMESEHSLGLPDDGTSMDIPVSSVPTMPPLRPTHISG